MINKTVVSFAENVATRPIVVPAEARYVRISFAKTATNAQFEHNIKITDFVEFNGKKIEKQKTVHIVNLTEEQIAVLKQEKIDAEKERQRILREKQAKARKVKQKKVATFGFAQRGDFVRNFQQFAAEMFGLFFAVSR